MRTVDERNIEKYKKIAKENGSDGWWLSYFIDEDDNERKRGRTIEFARASFETSSKSYTIIDVPGHRNYIPMMIDGTTQADVAILVISARSKEFESGFQKSGQTRQHIVLAKTLGILNFVVVVNKMDDISVNWSEERFLQIKKSISAYLSSIGYKDVPFIPISGFSGINVCGKVSQPSWFSGNSLIQTLDYLPPIPRDTKSPVIVPINYYDNEQGKYYINGKIMTGILKVGTNLLVFPGEHLIRVNTIFPIFGSIQTISKASAGDNVRLIIDGENLGAVLTKGSVLCEYPDLVCVSNFFVAEIQLLKLPPTSPIFSVGFRAIVHTCCTSLEGEVKKIFYELENGVKTKKTFVKSNARVAVLIELSRKAVMKNYDVFPGLGRITLRVGEETIGFGKILKCEEKKK